MGMTERKLREEDLRAYWEHLRESERASATIQKYERAIRNFFAWVSANGAGVAKETVIRYKEYLLERRAASGVNGELAALNGFFAYMQWHECRVRPVRVQCRSYCDPEKELSREEYFRLVNAAKMRKNERLALLMQTICSTGIRVSEVIHLTVEALCKGQMEVHNKGKSRMVFLPGALCARLRRYCEKRGIRRGSVFVTRTGRPLNRSNIWAMMKALCGAARVDERKVFPHNLRHLFARCFYQAQKDIEHLATILGHSSINTTRIYTRTSGAEHRRQLEQLHLLI